MKIMKLQKVFLILVVLLISTQIYFGQEKPKAVLIDEFGKICSEDLAARYDSFLSELQNNPTSIGYFVFYGDAQVEGRNLNYISYLRNYPEFRGFDTSRLILIRGENKAEMQIQLWLIPSGANLPKPEKKFFEQRITTITLFDKNWADFHKWSGELEIYSNGFYEWGCEFSPNIERFADILLSNSELTGYLIVYTKFGKGAKRGKQIINFAVRDLVKNHKVLRNRLKTIYGGNRKEPEIELWFVPKGEKPPIPKPDSKTKK